MTEISDRLQPAPGAVDDTSGVAEPAACATATLTVEGMTCASCALRIERGLRKVPGVTEAAVNLATERATVAYDPARAGVGDLVAKVRAVGYGAAPVETRPVPATPSADTPARERTTELTITGMTCASCARRVERALSRVPGVDAANVNLATERATVTYAPAEASLPNLIGAVERAGYGAAELAAPTRTATDAAAAGESPEDAEAQRRAQGLRRHRDTLLLGIALSLPVVILSMFF
ncbi:MAG: copper ion binding protein, partial [Ktedonobacterales bacterium]|nr:copper ion binding protein [Ktedonobacterales bacterium]